MRAYGTRPEWNLGRHGQDSLSDLFLCCTALSLSDSINLTLYVELMNTLLGTMFYYHKPSVIVALLVSAVQ